MSASAPLNPVWGTALGLESAALTTSVAASASAPDASEGWQPVRAAHPRPGAPIAIKKKLGPHLWISTTVRPGDPRYASAHQA